MCNKVPGSINAITHFHNEIFISNSEPLLTSKNISFLSNIELLNNASITNNNELMQMILQQQEQFEMFMKKATCTIAIQGMQKI